MTLPDLRSTLLAQWRSGPSPAVLAVADQGLVSGFGFLSGIATARLVGIGPFGRFALVVIFLSLAQNVHNALATAPMMTLIGSRTRPSRAYFASVIGASVVLSAAAGVIVAGLFGCLMAFWGEDLSWQFLAATALVGATQNLQFTLRRFLFACGQGLRAVVMDSLRMLSFLLGVVLLYIEAGALTVTDILWLLGGTSFLSCLPFILPLMPRQRRTVRLRAVSRRHLPLARWLLPVVLITFGQEQLVWLLSGGILGDHAIGGLRAAQYVVGLVMLLLTATENVIPVGAARAYAQEGRGGLNRYLLSTGTKLGLLFSVLLLAIAIPAEFWLKLIFGPAFVPFANCLRVLALAAVLVHVRDMATHVFRATQRTGVIFQAFTVSLVVSLLCLYPLMSSAGLIGAVLVVLIGHATSMCYLLGAAVISSSRARQPGVFSHAVPAGPASNR